MLTKTVRSRFSHETGEKVEGCIIIEKRVIIPPDPVERRLGVYDYLVEVPPTVVTTHHRAARATAASSSGAGTRTTPELHGAVIRRVNSR